MPGGWDDPYDAAATTNPFATRFVDQNETGSPTHRAVSNPQVISTRWDKDDQQDQGSKGSHRSNNSNKSHRSHNSSRHSGRKISDEAKTSGAALNNQNSVWGARGDNNGGKDGGWDSGFNNDGAQSNSWDTNNESKSGGNQGWDGNNGGNSSGWDNSKEQEQGGQQSGRADAGNQQNAGSGDQWGNNNASNDAGNSNWNNPTENDNAGATKSEWNNDSSGNQDRGGWNSTFENNQADSTKDQNEENKSSSSSTNDPWPDLDNTANQQDTNNWDIPVDNAANQEAASKWNDTRDKTAQQTNAGNWDTPVDASTQKTSGNWDVQPIVPAGANTSGSRKGSKAGSKAASDSTGSFMHRPAVLEQPYVKGYWKDWSHPRSTPRVPQPQPHAPNAPDDATDIYSPSEVPYVVPEETAREKAVNQYVHAGKGFNYSHITARPKYMDSLEQPYAIFRFKYRSRDMLGKILGRRTKAVIDQDAEREKVEERKRRLSELSKEELVQQVLQNSNAAGESQKAGSQKAESQMVGSQKAPSGNLPPIPEKPPSVSKWVDSVAGATTEGQQLSDGPGTCNRCQKDLPSEYWHCNICDSGDYDLCCHCVVDKKLRCSDDSHELVKWKEDMDLGNGMKGVKVTGEILPPVAKSSASKKGGSRSGGDNNSWAPDAGVPSGGNTGNWGAESGTAGPAGNTGVDQWTTDTATTANAGTGATGKVGNW
ncbi:Zinc finger zz-type protein [Neofusicoccum parvum]|nr:Zinc finger zz-type protein [Neofusicoccum parvum]